jgi:hypothetical protein
MYLYLYDIIRICVPCDRGTHNVGAVRMCILAIILMFLHIMCIWMGTGIHTYAHVDASIHAHTCTYTHTIFCSGFIYVLEWHCGDLSFVCDLVSATEQTGCQIFTEYSVGVIVNWLTLHSLNHALRYIYVRMTKEMHTLIWIN